MSDRIIGDMVNLASRIESLSKHHGAQLVISETVATRIPGTDMTSLAPTLVKGRGTPIEIFRLDYQPFGCGGVRRLRET